MVAIASMASVTDVARVTMPSTRDPRLSQNGQANDPCVSIYTPSPLMTCLVSAPGPQV
jgi:hypothetical protein